MSIISNMSSVYAQQNPALTNANAATIYSATGRLPEGGKTREVKKVNSQSAMVTISEEALKKLETSLEPSNAAGSSGAAKLSAEEQNQVSDLKSRDREVRSHEMAHMMVGGNLVRKGASYQYQTGPDGQRYAVGGEVSIDSSAVDGDPAATIRKMEQVKRAALAPAEPSGQDRAVSSAAAQTEAAALQELLQQKTTSS